MATRRRFTSEKHKAVLALLDELTRSELVSVRGSCANRLRRTRGGGRPRKANPEASAPDAASDQPWTTD
jgi:hypothetical protein